MKKVVCPSCGLVNLEKFVTFPFCAACGAHLPEKEPSKFRVFLTRPVKPLYWALSVGFGISILAFVALRIAIETRDRTEKSLLIYSQIPRRVAPDGFIYSSFTLDTTDEYPSATFADVRLRFAKETLQKFELVTITPQPTTRESFGSGQYYFWPNLKRAEAVRIVLVPKTTGDLPFRFMVYAKDHLPLQARNSILVTKPDLAKHTRMSENK